MLSFLCVGNKDNRKVVPLQKLQLQSVKNTIKIDLAMLIVNTKKGMTG